MYYEDAIKQYYKGCVAPMRAVRVNTEAFFMKSTAKWVCIEMITYIRKHPYLRPVDAATEFRLKLEDAGCKSVNSKHFFCTAEDTAQDIIDHIWFNH